MLRRRRAAFRIKLAAHAKRVSRQSKAASYPQSGLRGLLSLLVGPARRRRISA